MPVCNEFRDHFIGHITETKRPELLNSSRERDIGDLGKESLIESFQQVSSPKEMVHNFSEGTCLIFF